MNQFMNSRKYRSLTLWLGFIVPIVLFAGLLTISLIQPKTMKPLFASVSWYITLIMCLFWMVQLARVLHRSYFGFIPFLKKYRLGLIAALILTGIVFSSVPVAFKVLNDEALLLSVSQSMTLDKTAWVVSEGKYVFDNFHPLKQTVPKRPLLFPFAISLIHTVVGYHPWNVFILNFITTAVFLAGVYICVRQFSCQWTALAASILVIACPVFTIYATSGGYDLFSALFFYLAMVILYAYLRKPDADLLALLWMTLVMLGNIRYESCIYGVIVIAGIVTMIRWDDIKTRYSIYAWTPLLILPFIWQRILSVGRYENPVDVPLFSVASFIRNARVMAENLFNLGYYLPYAGILNVLAICISGYFISEIAQKKFRISGHAKRCWLIGLACVAVNQIIILSHHARQFDHPDQARLFYILMVLVSLAPVIFKIRVPMGISGKLFLAGAIVIFFIYHPIAVKNQFMNYLHPMRTNTLCRDYLRQLDAKNPLVITRFSVQYLPLGYSTVSFEYFHEHRKEIMDEIRLHLYDKVVVFTEVSYKTKSPMPLQGIEVDGNMRLKLIKRMQIWQDRYLAIAHLEL